MLGRELDNQIAMNHRHWDRQHDEAAIRLVRECGDASLDFCRVPDTNGTYLDPERWRCALDGAKLTDCGCILAKAIGLTRRPSHVDVDVAADCPARLLQTLQKCGEAALPLRIVRGQVHEHPDAPHPARLLRARRERPRGHCAAEQCDEGAPHHSITSSACCKNGSGIVRPSAFAVLRLTTSSNLLASCTGRSPGLAPFRMRST